MKIIILKQYYPHVDENISVEVSDEVAKVLSTGGRLCDSYRRRKRDHDECSLEALTGFERDAVYPPLTPAEIMEGLEVQSALYTSIAQLPTVQARRVYAYYILDKSKSTIAAAEGVSERNVRGSIQKGLENLRIILKNFC